MKEGDLILINNNDGSAVYSSSSSWANNQKGDDYALTSSRLDPKHKNDFVRSFVRSIV